MKYQGEESLDLDHNSSYIAEQFLENEPGNIEFQYFDEVYSVLEELEKYEGDEEARLVSHLDGFAEDIPMETSGGVKEPVEIAEELETFVNGRLYLLDQEFTGEEVLNHQVKAFIGDRLRYLEKSAHQK